MLTALLLQNICYSIVTHAVSWNTHRCLC